MRLMWILFVVYLALSFNHSAYAAFTCENAFESIFESEEFTFDHFTPRQPLTQDQKNNLLQKFKNLKIRAVEISKKKFDSLLSDLRATLSGNLATVWRSEWKTKLSVAKSNQYIYNILNENMSKQTFDYLITDVSINDEGFVRTVHARLYQLQKEGKLKPEDQITVRDAPPPSGVIDTTFTSYLKAMFNAEKTTKHQVRIRTYVRSVQFSKMKMNEPVAGFINDIPVKFTKLSEDQFEVLLKNKVFHYSQYELTTKYGTHFSFTAPHGQKFKLEIKSALEDQINSPYFEMLNGDHTVQKLDVALSNSQMQKLFDPLQSRKKVDRMIESLERVNQVEAELAKQSPEKIERTHSVLNVLRAGIKKNSKFLEIIGATHYHRSAFETSSGLQTTVDRSQGVYVGSMYNKKGIKSPAQVITENIKMLPSKVDDRHVELKAAINQVLGTMGIIFSDPEAAKMIKQVPYDADATKRVISQYNKFTHNEKHPGKFNYIRTHATDLGTAEDLLNDPN